ncbi:MAG: type II toxin-antitoxin system HigB family toxin [Bryobacterales bacterium]|nr:type II toxin-antitoxin system HigB family toxin [Bryobacterales bacterium]
MDAVDEHAETRSVVHAWYRLARKGQWGSLQDVRKTFPSADQVGGVLIFNVLGGNYRLVCRVSYRSQRLFFKALLTHGEYNRKEWMKWA